MNVKNLRPKDNAKFHSKNVKGFQPKDGAAETPNKETEAAMQEVREGRASKVPPKDLAPKLPTAEVTNNSTLKCSIASFNGLTWIGIKNHKGEQFWRACGTEKFKKIMDKAEAFRADAALDEKAKDAKVAEAIKSMSFPMPTVPFSPKSETGFKQPEAEKPAEVPAA